MQENPTQRTGTAHVRQVWKWLRGPRFIDLPTRVIVFIIAGTDFFPSAAESHAPGYLVFFWLSFITTVLAAFFPFASGLVSAALACLFSWVYPEMVNVFEIAIITSAAVALSQQKIRRFVGVAATFYLTYAVDAFLGNDGEFSQAELGTMTFGLVFGATLGAVALLFERSLNKEIQRRLDQGHEYREKLDDVRQKMVIDTHDLVSHGLATEAALLQMRLQDGSASADDDQRLMGELAMMNARTQSDLRSLLAKLTSASKPTAHQPVHLSETLIATAEHLTQIATRVGFPLTISIDPNVPRFSTPTFLEASTFILQELVTNIVKHADTRTECRIDIAVPQDNGDAVLRLRSTNSAPEPLDSAPRSIDVRATASGGTTTVVSGTDGLLEVTVRLPIPNITHRGDSLVGKEMFR